VGWSNETIIVKFEPGDFIIPEVVDSLPTISIDPLKGDLYVGWMMDKLYQTTYNARLGTWGGTETPFGTIFDSPFPRSLSSYYQKSDSIIGSIWVEGTEAPYRVTYAFQKV
jgi:hypothetical protein